MYELIARWSLCCMSEKAEIQDRILTDGDDKGCEGVTSHDSPVVHDVLGNDLYEFSVGVPVLPHHVGGFTTLGHGSRPIHNAGPCSEVGNCLRPVHSLVHLG